MEWYELNKENIEKVKELYYKYLEENKNNNYMANLLTFEEFLKELSQYEVENENI